MLLRALITAGSLGGVLACLGFLATLLHSPTLAQPCSRPGHPAPVALFYVLAAASLGFLLFEIIVQVLARELPGGLPTRRLFTLLIGPLLSDKSDTTASDSVAIGQLVAAASLDALIFTAAVLVSHFKPPSAWQMRERWRQFFAHGVLAAFGTILTTMATVVFLPSITTAPLFLYGTFCAMRWATDPARRSVLLGAWFWRRRAKPAQILEVRLLLGYLYLLATAHSVWQLAPSSWADTGLMLGLPHTAAALADTPWISYATTVSVLLACTCCASLEQEASRGVVSRRKKRGRPRVRALPGTPSPRMGTKAEGLAAESGAAAAASATPTARPRSLPSSAPVRAVLLKSAAAAAMAQAQEHSEDFHAQFMNMSRGFKAAASQVYQGTADFASEALSGRTGVGIVVASILAWALTTPCLLMLPLLAFAAWTCVSLSVAEDYQRPKARFKWAIAYTACIILVQWAAAAAALVLQPAAFGQPSVRADGYANEATLSHYSPWVAIVGLAPRPFPSLQFVVAFGVLGVLCLFYKLTQVRQKSRSAASQASSSSGGLQSTESLSRPRTESEDSFYSADLTTAKGCSLWLHAFFIWGKGALRLGLTFLRESSYVLVLVVLYVLTLGQVDIIHAVYLLMFVVALASPVYRRRYWRVLVAYTALAVLVTFTWHCVAFQASPSSSRLPSWILANKAVPGNHGPPPLWNNSVASHCLLLALSAVQLAQYEAEQSDEYREHMASLLQKVTWLRHLLLFLASIQLHYGLYAAFIGMLLLVTFPPVDVPSVLTQILGLLVLGVHLAQGTSLRNAGSKDEAFDRLQRLRGGVALLALLQALIFAAQYLFQFPGVKSFVEDQIYKNGWVTVQEAGFSTYDGSTLYIAFLDNVAMLILLLVQLRSIDKALNSNEDDLDRCITRCCRVLCCCCTRSHSPRPPTRQRSVEYVALTDAQLTPAASSDLHPAPLSLQGDSGRVLPSTRSTRRASPKRFEWQRQQQARGLADMHGVAQEATARTEDAIDACSSSGSQDDDHAACSARSCHSCCSAFALAAQYMYTAVYRHTLKAMFYHSGKVTLAAAFVAAAWQPTAWGAVCLLMAMFCTVTMVYRTDRSTWHCLERLPCLSRDSVCCRWCQRTCPTLAVLCGIRHHRHDAITTRLVHFQHTLSVHGDLQVSVEEVSPHTVLDVAAVEDASAAHAEVQGRLQMLHYESRQRSDQRRLMRRAGVSEAEVEATVPSSDSSLSEAQAALYAEAEALVTKMRAANLPRRPYRDVWAPFAVWAALGATVRYIFQFSFARSGRVVPAANLATAAALGLPSLPRADVNGTLAPFPTDLESAAGMAFLHSMWSSVMGPPLLLLLAAAIQRISHDFEADVLRWEAAESDEQESNGLSLAMQIENIVGLSHKWLSVAGGLLKEASAASSPGLQAAAVQTPATEGHSLRFTGNRHAALGHRSIVMRLELGPTAIEKLAPRGMETQLHRQDDASIAADIEAQGIPSAVPQPEPGVEMVHSGDEQPHMPVRRPALASSSTAGVAQQPAESAEERALAARAKVTCCMGTAKVLRLYSASILHCATCVALVLAALLHLDAFSLVYMVCFAIIQAPWWPLRILRTAVWHALVLTTCAITAMHYLGAVAWPSVIKGRLSQSWPWSSGGEWEYYFGSGSAVVGWTVLADCAVLLFASLTKKQWVHSQRRLKLHAAFLGRWSSSSGACCGVGESEFQRRAMSRHLSDLYPTYRRRVTEFSPQRRASAQGYTDGWLQCYRATLLLIVLRRWRTAVVREQLTARVYAEKLAAELLKVLPRGADLPRSAGEAAAVPTGLGGEEAVPPPPTADLPLLRVDSDEGTDLKAPLPLDVLAEVVDRVHAGAALRQLTGQCPDIELDSSDGLASPWDAAQYFVARYSIYAVLLCLFLIVTLQEHQDLIHAGYLAFNLWFLYRPSKLMQHGNVYLRWLRLYNFVVILAQVLYQMPIFEPPPHACVGRGTCFSWQTMLGLQKLRVVSVPGAADCISFGSMHASTADNRHCPSPFNWSNGLMPSLIVMVLGMWQSFVFDSSAYKCVQAHVEREVKLAGIRAEVEELLEVSWRSHAKEKAARVAVKRKERLRNLVARVTKWENMLAGEDVGVAVDPDGRPLWPPPPPRDVRVELLSPTEVRVSWKPPVGYDSDEEGGHDAQRLKYCVAVERQGKVLFGDFKRSPWTRPGAGFVELRGMLPLFAYEIKVVARSSAGAGAFCDSIVFCLPSKESSEEAFPVTVSATHAFPGAWEGAGQAAVAVEIQGEGDEGVDGAGRDSTQGSGEGADSVGELPVRPPGHVPLSRRSTSGRRLIRASQGSFGGVSPSHSSSWSEQSPLSTSPKRAETPAPRAVPTRLTVASKAELLSLLQQRVDPLVEYPADCRMGDARRDASDFTLQNATPLPPKMTVREAVAASPTVGGALGCVVDMDWPRREEGLEPEDESADPACCCVACDSCLSGTGSSVASIYTFLHWVLEAVADWALGRLGPAVDRTLFLRPIGRFRHNLRAIGLVDRRLDTATSMEDMLALRLRWKCMFAVHLAILGVLSNTGTIVGLAICINTLVYASALSVSVMLAYLLCIGWQYPRPHALAWDILIIYMLLVFAIKFVAQLPAFCLQLHATSSGFYWHWAAFASCEGSGLPDFKSAQQFVQPTDIVGVSKLGAAYGGPGFFAGVLWDFILIGALLLHKAVLKIKGLWLVQRGTLGTAAHVHILAAHIEGNNASDAGGASSDSSGDSMDDRDATGSFFSGAESDETDTALAIQTYPSERESAKASLQEPLLPGAETKHQAGEAGSPGYCCCCSCACCSPEAQQHQATMKHSHDEVDDASCACCASCAGESKACLTGYAAAVLDPDALDPPKPGRDLYLWTFIVQFITLIFVMVAFNQISDAGGAGGISQELAFNQLSPSMVVAVLGIVVWMVVERLGFLLRSLMIKVILQVALVLSLHVVFFFTDPLTKNVPLSGNPASLVAYLLLLSYFLLGCLQIYWGYGRHPPQNSIFDASRANKHVFPFNIFVTIFLSVPFLLELRALLDWVSTRTSLDVFQWLRLHNVETLLLENQTKAAHRKHYSEYVRGQEPRAFCCEKCCSGVVLFLALTSVILLPLVLFSGLNPTLQKNFVEGATVQVSLKGPGNTYTLFSSSQVQFLQKASSLGGYWARVVDSNSRTGVRNAVTPAQRKDAQLLTLYPFSASEWTVNPPTVSNLLGVLSGCSNQTLNATLQVEYTFTRPAPVDNAEATSTSSTQLTAEHCGELLNTVQAAFSAPEYAWQVPFKSNMTLISDTYPMVLRLPGASDPFPISTNHRTLGLRLFRDTSLSPRAGLNPSLGNVCAAQVAAGSGGMPTACRAARPKPAALGVSLWWAVTNEDGQVVDPSSGLMPPRAGADVSGLGLQFSLVSDELPPQIITQALGASGILAMYLTIVLTVGRMARTSLAPRVEDAIYSDMPQCDALQELVEGVAVSRTESYPGHLRDEARLFHVLLKLLRSPTILLRITADPDEE